MGIANSMSRRRPVRFLAISLPGDKSYSGPMECSICHREVETTARCYLCGKAICAQHSVRRTLGKLGRVLICEGCDLAETRQRLRRGLEDQATGLKDAIISLTPVLDDQKEAGSAAIETLIQLQDQQHFLIESLRERKAELQSLVASFQVTSLQTALEREESATQRNNQQSIGMEAETEGLLTAQYRENLRLSGLQCELQEYQRQLRHSLPPAQVQTRCCPRCKSHAQRAFKGLDLFSSRLNLYDSQLLPTVHKSEPRACALF
jgi:hypothetical protein